MQTAMPEITSRRRWPTPPPLTEGGEGRLSGGAVLEEFPDEGGMLLWQSLRGVNLWAATAPVARAALFLPGAAPRRMEALRTSPVASEVRGPLGKLAGVLDGSAEAAAVAQACEQVTEWAEEQDRLGTALAFMEAAALALPSRARSAYLAGRLARRRAEYARAETWFYEAISRALGSRDWDSYARAFIGLGNQHIQRGNYPAAKRCHSRALRIARKRGLREAEALALHDLFVIAMWKDEQGEAEFLALEVLRHHGLAYPKLPELVYDLGCFWVNHGKYARALPLFRAVLPHLRGRRERVLATGAIARSAGALGDTPEFLAAWDRLWEELEDAAPDGCAQALAALAEGAVSLQNWDCAERAAKRAFEIAQQRGESLAKLRAESVLDQVRTGRNARAVRRLPERASIEEDDTMVREFVVALGRSIAGV